MFNFRARWKLDELPRRQERLRKDWHIGDQSPQLNFYVSVMTRLLGAERAICREQGGDRGDGGRGHRRPSNPVCIPERLGA